MKVAVTGAGGIAGWNGLTFLSGMRAVSGANLYERGGRIK